MARLLCIRHAQSTWNELGRWQGQADPPLSEAGRSAAFALAERLGAELARNSHQAATAAAHLGGLSRDSSLRALDVATATPPLPSVGIASDPTDLRGLATHPGENRGLSRCRALVTSDLVRARQTAVILGCALKLTPEPWPQLREADIGHWSGRVSAEIEALWPEDYRRFRAGDPELRLGGGESRRALRARALAAVRELEQRWGGEPIVVVTHLGWLRALAPGLELGNAGTLWLDSAALAGDEPSWRPEEAR